MSMIIAIGGRPGSGKTALVRKFLERGQFEAIAPAPLIHTMYDRARNVHVLGKYEAGETFAGTDKLSMSVQPRALQFIQSTTADVLFEGDRLFNASFLSALLTGPRKLLAIYLAVDDDILEARYKQRGSNQSEQFLRGRETKYKNILSAFDGRIAVLPHNTPAQQEQALWYIDTMLYNNRKQEAV